MGRAGKAQGAADKTYWYWLLVLAVDRSAAAGNFAPTTIVFLAYCNSSGWLKGYGYLIG